MTEISTTSWSEVDGSNNQFPPDGWPAGMFPNAVEPTARADKGGLKRFWNRINPVYPATQSTADSYVITPTQAITGYGLYEMWRVRMPIANASTSPQLLISSLPPQALRKIVGSSITNLVAGDIRARAHELYWDGTQFIVTDPAQVAAVTSVGIGSDTTQGILVSGSPITDSGIIALRLDPTRLAAKASPTSADTIFAGDSAASNVPKRVLFSAILGASAPGLLTAKASPTSSDNIVIGDAAAVNAPKITTVSQVLSLVTGRITPGTALVLNPWAVNTAATIPHGLSGIPTLFDVTLECLSADLNYAAGDLVKLPIQGQAGSTAAYNVYVDSTSISIVTHVSNGLFITDKVSHANSIVAAAKWKLTIKPGTGF